MKPRGDRDGGASARLLGRASSEEGGVSVLFFACLAVALALALLTADIGGYLLARHRAQNAADAAALAAVSESFPLFTPGGNPEKAASGMSSANGARLESIEVSASGDRVQVTASCDFRSLTLGPLGIGPDRARARAAAEVDIEGLLASSDIWYTASPTGSGRLVGALASLPAGAAGDTASLVALLSLQHLGKPYAWGAAGPFSFDCSGLVCFVYAQAGVRLPRVTYSQARAGIPVSPSELKPGDLVFFRGNAHVGIYIGGGHFVHAPHTGDVVRIAPLAGRTLSACRRIIR